MGMLGSRDYQNGRAGIPGNSPQQQRGYQEFVDTNARKKKADEDFNKAVVEGMQGSRPSPKPHGYPPIVPDDYPTPKGPGHLDRIFEDIVSLCQWYINLLAPLRGTLNLAKRWWHSSPSSPRLSFISGAGIGLFIGLAVWGKHLSTTTADDSSADGAWLGIAFMASLTGSINHSKKRIIGALLAIVVVLIGLALALGTIAGVVVIAVVLIEALKQHYGGY